MRCWAASRRPAIWNLLHSLWGCYVPWWELLFGEARKEFFLNFPTSQLATAKKTMARPTHWGRGTSSPPPSPLVVEPTQYWKVTAGVLISPEI